MRILKIITVSLCLFSLLVCSCFASDSSDNIIDMSTASDWYTLFSGKDLLSIAMNSGACYGTYNYYCYTDGSNSSLVHSHTSRIALRNVMPYPVYRFGTNIDDNYTNRDDFYYLSIDLDCPIIFHFANYIDQLGFGINGYSSMLKRAIIYAVFADSSGGEWLVHVHSFQDLPDSYFIATESNGKTYYSLKNDIYFSVPIQSHYGEFKGFEVNFVQGNNVVLSADDEDTFSITECVYHPTATYNPNLEKIIQTMNESTDKIVDSIDSAAADIIDLPGVEFVPPEGASEEEAFVGELSNLVSSFGENVNLQNVLDGGSIQNVLNSVDILYVSKYILDPLFEKTPFGSIIKITVPISLLFIILGFAGHSARSRSEGGGDGRIYTTYRELPTSDPVRSISSSDTHYLPGG